MTKKILFSVALGILAGYFVLPSQYAKNYLVIVEPMLVFGLCVLLFFVGIDLGMDGNLVSNFKKVGWRIIVFPFAIIVGTMVGALIASLVLPISGRESMAIGAGFGWYTLAPVILTKYSAQISAISFMHNIMREFFAMILIPIVAKKIGYIECFSLAGAPAMDVCLPVVEQSTNANIAVYSFISGVMLSIAVPVMVPLLAGI